MGLILINNPGFIQAGPARWLQSGWELDRLVVPVQGPYSGLAAYIAGLTMWSASGIDSNMFLGDFSVNTDKHFPIVDLVYLGKRGGTLPPDRHSNGESIQQARYTTFSGKSYVNMTYVGPTSTKVIWSRTTFTVSSISPTAPGPITIGYGSQRWDTSDGGSPGSFAAQLALFIGLAAETGEVQELVPGQYFRGTATQINMLLSTAA